MMKRLAMIAALSGALCAHDAMSDELDMRNTSGYSNPSAPQRGMSMQRVESSWGQPTRRRSAVGQPPITRWEYDGFIVYFEYDKVIHTVTQRG